MDSIRRELEENGTMIGKQEVVLRDGDQIATASSTAALDGDPPRATQSLKASLPEGAHQFQD